MTSSTKTLIVFFTISTLLLYSCKKTDNNAGSPAAGVTTIQPHVYGLLSMTPDQWASVPVFSQDLFPVTSNAQGLSAPSLPNSYLLASPAVRDQGQIGSCTGFCGMETDEILYYYNGAGSSGVSSSNFTSSSTVSPGISQAVTNQVVNNPLLSPLFLYYVERCVILKQSISSDNGAYMVDIPEAFQGLSNNSGSGSPLALKGTTFAGICFESDYAYPSNGSDKSTQYKTAPSGNALTDDFYFKIAQQNGTTGSSGSTIDGYYVINSSDPVTDVKTALVNNKPVMMGFNVYDNSRYQYFEGLNTSKYTYNPLTSSGSLASGLRLLGGHAVPIIGFINDSNQPGGGVFICENSWNTSWGYYGYFYLPYSVLKSTKIVPAGNLYVAII
jgi:C1A family cysteine protease